MMIVFGCSTVKSCPLIAATDFNLCFYWKMCINLLYLLRVKSTLRGHHFINSVLKMQIGCQQRDKNMLLACSVLKGKS